MAGIAGCGGEKALKASGGKLGEGWKGRVAKKGWTINFALCESSAAPKLTHTQERRWRPWALFWASAALWACSACLSASLDLIRWSALWSTGWPWLLFPRTCHGEMLISCRDAGPAVRWFILCLESQMIIHHIEKDHPRPWAGNANSENLHTCPALRYMTDFGLQFCVPRGCCQLTAPASISDGFWAPDPTGVRLQGVRKQFQIFLEVLKICALPHLPYSSPQWLYTLQKRPL